MKPLLRNTSPQAIHSFTARELVDSYFDPNWHFHPEYQLFLVLKGTGTRLIGDSISHFEEGDLVLLGPNLPHMWRNDPNYFVERREGATHGIVVYFTEDFLGEGFFEKQEMVDIRHLLKKAHLGMEILGATRQEAAARMQELTQASGFESILQLLGILHLLSVSTELHPISSLGFVNSHKPSETERMSRVHEYVMTHFRQEIRLEDIAAVASMSPAAFCRYFKLRTRKTLSDFVSEVRVGHACKLLIDEKMNITQIAYECGYKTLSHFNRQFRTLTHESPLSYRKKYVGEIEGLKD
jgi:AraC-like DNA-binding protein